MDKAEAKAMLLDRAKRIVEHIEQEDLWSAVWGVSTLQSHLENNDILAGFGKVLVWEEGSMMNRRLIDVLDSQRITEFGKFEGQTKATPYVWNCVLDQVFVEDFTHEGFGYFALYKRTHADPLKFPYYIVNESNETGFVSMVSYDSEEEALTAWKTVVAELGGDL